MPAMPKNNSNHMKIHENFVEQIKKALIQPIEPNLTMECVGLAQSAVAKRVLIYLPALIPNPLHLSLPFLSFCLKFY